MLGGRSLTVLGLSRLCDRLSDGSHLPHVFIEHLDGKSTQNPAALPPVRKKGDASSTCDNITDAVGNLLHSGTEGSRYRWADARVMRCSCARLSSSATKTMPREAIE